MAHNKFVTTDEQHHRARQKHVRSQKFVTTAKQQKVRKAYYGLRTGWQHKKSAVDPEWFANRQQQDPYFYHRTEADAVPSIAANGLFPFDSQENPRGSQFGMDGDPELMPRSGHVYLADKNTIKDVGAWLQNGKVLRVDSRKLDPQKFAADEDSYVFHPPPYPQKHEDNPWGQENDNVWAMHDYDDHPVWCNFSGRVIPRSAFEMYHEPLGRKGTFYDNPKLYREGLLSAFKRNNIPTWGSFGEWANENLNDPLHTRWSIQGNGTVAYGDHVPPEAIEVQQSDGSWLPATHLDNGKCEFCDGHMGQDGRCLNCGEKPWDEQVKDLEREEAEPDGGWGPFWKEHERLKQQEHVAAVDPYWLKEWMEENGPYLYHGTNSKEAQDSIMRDGLYPHDEPKPNEVDEWQQYENPSRSEWGGGKYLEPRSGHVYMGTASKAGGYVTPGGGMLAIDLRELDPRKINADEDSFNTTYNFLKQDGEPFFPTVHKYYDRNHFLYDPPVHPHAWEPGMEGLGQWADRVGLGDDPEETHHSLNSHGSIAYNGVIPPHAIRPGYATWMGGDLEWTPEEAMQQHAASADNSLHIGLPIPRNAASHIHRWVKDQQWPEGTELEPPREYHITLLFAPDGHEEHSEGWWIQHLEKARAKVTGFDVFPSSEREGLNAYVLRVESPEIEEHANKLMDSAEWAGLEPSRFPGGYKAHITIAYGPGEVKVSPPMLEFDVGPSEVSPRRAQSKWEVTAYTPEEAQVLDHLSLASVAHNLHYKFEQGTTDPQGIVDYAKRLLQMVGYPDDKVTTQAAIQAWQQLYPQDQALAAPDIQPVQKNLPSAQANYVKRYANPMQLWEPGVTPAQTPLGFPNFNDWPEAPEQPGTVLPAEWNENLDYNSEASLAAMNHTGQIQGDLRYSQAPVRITDENPNRGVNPSYLGTVDEQPVYIKPEGGFHSNDLAHERAAFAVAREMGIPAPHTLVRAIPDPSEWNQWEHSGRMKLAQIQESLGGHSAMRNYYDAGHLAEDYPQRTREIALLDHVIGNQDRHMGNVVIGGDGEIYPIDHGGSFPRGEYYTLGPSEHFEDAELTPEEIERLKRVREMDLTPMGLSDEAQWWMKGRIDKMLERGKMNSYGVHPIWERLFHSNRIARSGVDDYS